ncbi:unnamed protein product [Thlaspi arvense]|uniref:Uncharacterized protein n=1 Tax=Thlaspi arvense TaxID=13288 RepID=A0AAU9SEL2_THLAR|nr:unnamed protein product [Thlaspi arvense]
MNLVTHLAYDLEIFSCSCLVDLGFIFFSDEITFGKRDKDIGLHARVRAHKSKVSRPYKQDLREARSDAPHGGGRNGGAGRGRSGYDFRRGDGPMRKGEETFQSLLMRGVMVNVVKMVKMNVLEEHMSIVVEL